ncbi:MAG: hypothetical protein ICV54_13490 [Nostoc sp. C3-bin3]|nr:hypothetical protein [Nostoc sp. C3-bin3]
MYTDSFRRLIGKSEKQSEKLLCKKVKDDLELGVFTGIPPDDQQDMIFSEEAGSKGQGERILPFSPCSLTSFSRNAVHRDSVNVTQETSCVIQSLCKVGYL